MSDNESASDASDIEIGDELSDDESSDRDSSSESEVDDDERSPSKSGKERSPDEANINVNDSTNKPETSEKRIKKDIALTKLCIRKLFDIRDGESVKMSTDNVKTKVIDGLLRRGIVLNYQDETIFGKIPVYFCQMILTKEKKGVAGNTDKNSGEIWFVYWGTSLNDVTIYSFIRSGFSGAWKVLSDFRDYSFPKDFARVFLSPCKIKKIIMDNLIGVSSSSRTLTYNKDNLFKPYHVTKEYGMVKNLTSFVQKKHSELNGILNTESNANKTTKSGETEKATVTIQEGQIKLPLTVTQTGTEFHVKEYINLLFLVDGELNKSKDKCKDDLHWQFLDYMEFIIDKNQKEKLDNKLRNEMFHYLKTDSDPSCFDPEAALWHHHQDTFYNCSSVKLLHKLSSKKPKIVYWSSNVTKRKGFAIQTKDVFKALKNDSSIEIKQANDLKNISIQFWDEKEEIVCLENMIPAHVLSLRETDSTTGKTKRGVSFFKQGKSWYSVIQNWYFDTTQRFVNAVKDCYYKVGDKDPEILPWNLPSDENTKFSMEDLYSFCVPPNRNNNLNADRLKKLRDILVKDTHLFTSTGDNNLLDEFADEKHSTEYLLLNKSLITKSTLYKDLKKNPHSLHPETCNFIDKSKEKLEEKLKKERKICAPSSDPDYTIIETPHLTRDIWKEVNAEFPQICPLRLCQFIRMNYSLAEERDYNQLYHLSNCKCRDNQWNYVVGDRIFGPHNYNIELFDVMAINRDRTKAFLLHVKNKIDASAFRNVCSQVKNSIEYLWNSLMAHSIDDMMERFYDVSTKSNESFHKRLTRKEMETFFKTKDEFLQTMVSENLKYYVCLAPCLSDKRKLEDLTNLNLDHKFIPKDFSLNGCFANLKKLKILNAVSGRITPKFFSYTSMNEFVNEMKEEKRVEFSEDQSKEIYKCISHKITNGTNTPLLNHKISFIAKSSFVDLYHEHQQFKIVHGKIPIQLCIVQIDRLQGSKKQTTQHSIEKYFVPKVRDKCENENGENSTDISPNHSHKLQIISEDDDNDKNTTNENENSANISPKRPRDPSNERSKKKTKINEFYKPDK